MGSESESQTVLEQNVIPDVLHPGDQALSLAAAPYK